MKKITTIAIAELKTLFFSPVAWLILVLFAIQTAMVFTSAMKTTLQSEMMGHALPNLTMWVIRYSEMSEYLYLYVPLLTMGLMSRELSTGTIKLLLSSPVSNLQIIFGKYLSMLLYGLLLIGILAIYGIFGFFTIKDVDLPIVLAGLGGIFLLFATYAAIGLFMSCLTSYQVAAAIGTLAVFAALNYVNHVWQSIDFVRDITYWLSITGRASNLLVGLINSEDILYFLIIISLFITLSILKLNGERQKLSRFAGVVRWSFVVLLALAAGYISSRPKLMSFLDVTRTKMNTLTPNSQAIVSQLKGPLRITTYVNLFEQNFAQALPEAISFDRQHFKQYLRFKPDMDLKYVYYYAHTDSPSSVAESPGLTDKQRLERACVTYELDPDLFLTRDELAKTIDLSGENYRFVRVLETPAGNKGYLRLFDDLTKQPEEREISAAMKSVATTLPSVGFVVGHGEREINDLGGRGYSQFTVKKSSRLALVNQGFDVQRLDLHSPIGANIKIVVLADSKTALSGEELKNLLAYIERGGNLLLIGGSGRQSAVNPLAAHFGVVFQPGRLVQPRPNQSPYLIQVTPTDAAVAAAYELKGMLSSNGVVAMDRACGLSYSTDQGYTVTPWFATKPNVSWNELTAPTGNEDEPDLKPTTRTNGEVWPTVLAVTRNVAGQQQRIIVMSDADCLDNAELMANRPGIRSMNSTLVNGLFYWLSNGESPIDVRRPPLTDNQIRLTMNGMARAKLVFVWILPGVIGMLGVVSITRRRRQ